MSIKEARERMRHANAAAANAATAKADAAKTIKAISVKADRLRAKAAKTHLLVQRPGRIHITSIAGLKVAYVGTAEQEAIRAAGRKAIPVAIEMIATGATKVSLAGEGTALSLRGLVQRSRVLTPEANRRIATARRAEQKASEALYRAQRHHVEVVTAAYEAAAKIGPEPIAEYLGERMAQDIAASVVQRGVPVDWQIESEVEHAKKHLDHALSKSKDPCPCRECIGAANRVRWNAQSEADAKAKAKALATTPKRLFTCPTCGKESISTVIDGKVKCQSSSWECRGAYSIEVIRTKAVPKSATLGVVQKEAA